MTDKKPKKKDGQGRYKEKIVSNQDVKSLVLARIRVLSPDTMIAIGSGVDLSRDDLGREVEEETDIGEVFAEIQMEWLRSFKKSIL